MIALDNVIKKKAGRHIEGLDCYRNSVGSARQAYHPLRGVHFVLGVMCLSLTRWPGHYVTLPIGWARYRKAPWAKQRRRGYGSRSPLARGIVDCGAKTLPARAIRVLAEGGYTTKDWLRALPPSAQVVSRRLISAQLYEVPKPALRRRWGSRRTKGSRWWDRPKPSPASAQDGATISQKPERRSHPGWDCGIRSYRVGPSASWSCADTQPKRPPCLAADNPGPLWKPCFTTDLTRSVDDILKHYRDGQAFYGLGQDQCRKWRRIVGANTFRLVVAAARTLGFVAQAQRMKPLDLCRYRP